VELWRKDFRVALKVKPSELASIGRSPGPSYKTVSSNDGLFPRDNPSTEESPDQVSTGSSNLDRKQNRADRDVEQLFSRWFLHLPLWYPLPMSGSGP
jgi:hypothetical protein